jgi:c-di-GMP-binding flagellar brake protein YcgR
VFDRVATPPQTAGPSGAERRSFVRVPFHKAVTVYEPPKGPRVEARTLDVSLGGVGLMCREALPRGRAVVVVFILNDPRLGAREEHVPGKVVHLAADVDSNRLGVEFDEPVRASAFPALARAVARL